MSMGELGEHPLRATVACDSAIGNLHLARRGMYTHTTRSSSQSTPLATPEKGLTRRYFLIKRESKARRLYPGSKLPTRPEEALEHRKT